MNLDFLHSASWFEYSEVKPWFFTSHSFFVVLGLVLVVYALLKPLPKPALVFLCAFSLFFYYKSSGLFLILFIAMIACDYVMARLINQFKGKARNVVFYLALVCSLSPLLYFKYTTLFVETCNMYLGTHFVSQQYFLPIGISFYTFQSLSYIIDVYRNTLKANGSFLNYVFYMTFFPHLVAGPIVRAKDFLPQISNATLPNTSQCSWALLRICRGLAKKLILADFLGQWVDMVHLMPEGYSGFETTIAVYAYAFQIYFDFSGYSDIALGIASLLGYELKENFNLPYTAQNISDFWRRWHMSLSSWLKDYIYIPLGGNRKGKFLTYIFLISTMLIGGLWHGASWRFLFWGLAHGLALALHKVWSTKPFLASIFKKAPLIGVLFTFNLVCLLWILFRAESAQSAFVIAGRCVTGSWNLQTVVGFISERWVLSIIFMLSTLWIFFPENRNRQLELRLKQTPLWISFLAFTGIFILAYYVRQETIQPFIYFQF